jgi:uroporphyrinogen decarboxylase
MKSLLKVLNGKKSEIIPIWLMRQAGRYLPEYRELRASKGGFLEMALDPVSACEITMQPIRRFGMDGAIIFSDILTVPYALGQDLWFEAGEGPKLGERKGLGFDQFDKRMEPVYEALRLTKAQLTKEGFDDTALIGFAGAPWTVATYMVERGGSKDHFATKAMAYGQEQEFSDLIDMLVEATSRYLIAQAKAGAEVLKIFDSWSGVLSEGEFEKWAVQPVRRIVAAVKAECPHVPIIGFPRGAGFYYERYVRETGVDACAIDSMMPLDYVRDHVQVLLPVQGNLDPAALLAGGAVLEREVMQILSALGGQPFIFNLGHGINKDTPINHVEQLMRIVKEYRT